MWQYTLMTLPFPSLIMMIMLWVNCSCLDNLPANAVTDRRRYYRAGVFCLVTSVVFMAICIYNLPNLLEGVQALEQARK